MRSNACWYKQDILSFLLKRCGLYTGEGKEAPKQKSEMADKSTVYLSDLLLGNMYSNGTIVFVDGTDEAKGML